MSICCAALAAAAFALPDRAAASGDSGRPPQSDLTARHSLGSILYVPSQYPTIQAALDAASDGDEIRVANGTYTGPGNYDLDFHGKAVTLRSASGDSERCSINCAWEGRGFWFHSGETAASVVEGFTIRNGYPPAYTFDGRGGGIFCSNGSSPTVSNCIVDRCSSEDHVLPEGAVAPAGGGGLACVEQSHPTVRNCLFEWCRAPSAGAGVLCDSGSNPVLTGCTIRLCIIDNDLIGSHGGGGLACLNGSQPVLADCVILRNVAREAAGIYCHSSNPTFTRCSIVENDGYASSGIGGLACFFSDPTLRDCTIVGNEGNYAGGICCDHSSPVLVGCTIAENISQRASALLCEWYSYPQITACRITAGAGEDGSPLPPAILCRGAAAPTLASCLVDDTGGLWAHSYAHPVVRNCTFTGSIVSSYSSTALLQGSIMWPGALRAYTLAGRSAQLSLSYCDVEGGEAAVEVDSGSLLVWGAGNLDADPLFVSPNGPDGDPSTWEDNDYHLSAGSPCIDAGIAGFTPSTGETDIDGQYRVWQTGAGIGGRADMGADEFGAPYFGDLNCDGAINVFDIDPFVLALTDAAAYSAAYPACGSILADLNGDGERD